MGLYETLRHCLDERTPVAIATVVAGPSAVGSKMLIYRDGATDGALTPADLSTRVGVDAARLLRDEKPDTIDYSISSDLFSVFIDVYPAPHQLVIVGASHAAGPLARMAKILGYHVVITDARSAFARADRFPEADSVLKGWPQDVLPTLRLDESTYLVLLSHDPKFDGPTLQLVLPSPVPYIGAIGSRKTQRERFQRLRDEGFSEVQLARIHGPVGLDLGGSTPEETALAILAEVTAVRRGKRGGFLRDSS